MNSREITTQISEAADSLNLKKWDYGASFSNDYSVQVDKGEAKQLKASQKQILTIRVWNQSNLVGITTTSDISESGIKKALNQANIASDFGNKKECAQGMPPSCFLVQSNIAVDSFQLVHCSSSLGEICF